MQKDLIGGAVFFRSNSWISKIVRFAGLFQKGHRIHKWSHVGDIFRKDDKLYLVEARSAGVTVRLFGDALYYYKNKKYSIEIKELKNHFIFNEIEYNKAINAAIGADYNFVGAIAAGIDIPINIKTSKAMHCSYLSAKLKQAGGVLNKQYNAREFTPDDCYNSGIYK